MGYIGVTILLCIIVLYSALALQKDNAKFFEKFSNEDYEVVYPTETDHQGKHISRFLRDVDKPEVTFFKLKAFNNEITLKLKRNSNILAKDSLIEAHNDDGTLSKLESGDVGDCLYAGEVESDENSMVSLTTCDGLYGVIRTRDEHFVIEPLPQDLQKRDAEFSHEIAHIIYKNKEKRESGCGANHVTSLNDFYKRSVNVSFDRVRRVPAAGARQLVVETAVFADYYLFNYVRERHPSDVENRLLKLILTFINGIQILYNHPSLGQVPIKFVVMKIEVFRVDKHPWRLSDYGLPMMENFCEYQASINIQIDNDPRHWDHGILMSGVDMRYPDGGYNLIGVSPIGGLCTARRSCSITEGMNFMDMYILAHELGHNFGMEHDGDGNQCNGQQFFMAPFTEPHHVQWSVCSRNYIASFLRVDFTGCLLDDRVPENNFNHEGILPGQRFTLEEQCQLYNGIHAVPDPAQPLHEICYAIKCLTGLFSQQSHSAIEGTYCGQGRWCRNKKCVPWGNNGPRAVNGGWGPWTQYTNCQSGCMANGAGISVSRRSCNSPSPLNGGQPCQGERYRFQLCQDNQLCRSRGTAETVSRSICPNKPDYMQGQVTGVGEQRFQDKSGGCTVWCDTTRNDWWISWDAQFPIGTNCGNGNSNRMAFCYEGKCIDFTCPTRDNCVGTAGPLYH